MVKNEFEIMSYSSEVLLQ